MEHTIKQITATATNNNPNRVRDKPMKLMRRVANRATIRANEELIAC